MRISDQLIELVLSGGGTEEEKRGVMDLLRKDPEKLAQYLTEESWEAFEANARVGAPRDKMLREIEGKVGNAPVFGQEGLAAAERGPEELREGASVRRMRYGWMAAASVVLVAGLIALLYRHTGHKTTNDTAAPAVVMAPAVAPAKKETIQTIANTSLKSQTYSLADGSSLKLAAQSSISFDSSFVNHRRDFYLKGEAVFTVAKDKKRPFTVHSRGISTTALGTVFSVNDRGSQFTTVHLYSGRVVVKKEAGEGKYFKDVYLLPGQYLLLNHDFSVQAVAYGLKIGTAKAPAPMPQHGDLQFTKQPLAEIFNLLQKQYAITISYDVESLKNMDFTGVFNKDKETLESFLSTLCELNDLTLKKTSGNTYSIGTK